MRNKRLYNEAGKYDFIHSPDHLSLHDSAVALDQIWRPFADVNNRLSTTAFLPKSYWYTYVIDDGNAAAVAEAWTNVTAADEFESTQP